MAIKIRYQIEHFAYLTVLLALMFFPQEAHLSQEFYESIALKDLVAMSDVVAVAVFENPPTTKRTFQYTVKRQVEKDIAKLSFEGQIYHFKLTEILKDKRTDKAGNKVSLVDPRLRQDFNETYQYASTGEMKSPIIFTYTGRIGENQIEDLAKTGQPVILFFCKNNLELKEPHFKEFNETFGGYDLFSAWFSIDEVALKEKVQSMISKEVPYHL